MNQVFRRQKGLPSAFISPEEMRKKFFLTTYELDGELMGGHLTSRTMAGSDNFIPAT